MKSRKITILIAILVLFTFCTAMIHFKTRMDVPKEVILISAGENEHFVDIEQLEYKEVTGTRVNGKGEKIPVKAPGILVKDLLAEEGITDYKKVTVISDDTYSAEVTAEESTYLILEDDARLRMIVFGDENSKRSVVNVAQIVVE